MYRNELATERKRYCLYYQLSARIEHFHHIVLEWAGVALEITTTGK